jgi:phosphate transport system substrate-binding protein
VYVNYKPGAQLDPLRSEFVRYVFSREGQADVLKDGYYPVTASIATKALASVGLASAADAQRSPAVGEAATR